jgi:hypothetical protein
VAGATSAETGTYTISGSTITLVPQVARNPNIVGQEINVEYMLDGDTLTTTGTNPGGITAKTTLMRLK